MPLAYITKSGKDFFLYTAEGKAVGKVINFKDEAKARRELKKIASEQVPPLTVTSQMKALASLHCWKRGKTCSSNAPVNLAGKLKYFCDVCGHDMSM